MERKQRLRTLVHYAGSHFAAQIMGVVTSLARPLLLSPEMFGLFSLFRAVPTWATYFHLGSRSAMRYRVPALMREGKEHEVQRVQGAVFWGSLILNAVAAGVLVGAGLLQEHGIRHAFFYTAILVLLLWYVDFHISCLKGYQRFGLVSAAKYLEAVLGLSGGVLLILYLGINGAFLAMVLPLVGIILLFHRKKLPSVRAGFDLPLFKELVRTGFPILIFDLLLILLRTTDRYVVALFLDPREVGYYGLGAMIMGFLLNIPGVSREVVESELMAGMGNQDQRHALFVDYFLVPLKETAWLMPLIVGPGILLASMVLEHFLPEYQPATVPLQILMVGGYFLALSYPCRGIVVAGGWQRRLAELTVPILLVDLAGASLLARLGYGIRGVAAASCLSFVLVAVVSIGFTLHRNRAFLPDFRAALPALLLPFPLTAILLLGIHRVASGWGALLGPLAGTGLFVALFLPILWWAGRRGFWSGLGRL